MYYYRIYYKVVTKIEKSDRWIDVGVPVPLTDATDFYEYLKKRFPRTKLLYDTHRPLTATETKDAFGI